MRSHGLGAQVFAGAWLSDKFDLEVLSFGRAADAPKDSTKLELTGHFLAYDITLDNGWIQFSVAVMDRGDPPELLLAIGDNSESWRTICRVVSALERNNVKALQPRPLQVGEIGPNGWLIA